MEWLGGSVSVMHLALVRSNLFGLVLSMEDWKALASKLEAAGAAVTGVGPLKTQPPQ